jgi:hypothetical protein
MVILSGLGVLGAAFVVYVALLVRWLECDGENASGCSTGGLIQFVLALIGLALAIGMLVASARARGHPWRWFAAAIPVYALWAIFLVEANG